MKSLIANVAITSRDNVKFKALRALAEDAREPRKQGRAIADGIHLVATAIARGAQIQQLIISEGAQSLVRSGKRKSFDEGYKQGQSDSVKQQYWRLQEAQRAPK